MLKNVLRANAASCALFGAVFALAAPAAAEMIGDPPVLLLQILGFGLLANAVLLIWTSNRRQQDRTSILLFAIGDGLWVAATAVLLLGGLWITTASGVASSIGIAAFVGTCGVLQWKFAPTNT